MRPSCGISVSPFTAMAVFTPPTAASSSRIPNSNSVFTSNELLLIDECLTPDSSRFWPADSYEVGASPLSYDKQFVRDYLETLDWDKTPPAPRLPPEIIEKTAQKYQEAFHRLADRASSEVSVSVDENSLPVLSAST